MAEEKSLIKGLITAMKAAGFATKDDVRGIIGEEITSRGLPTKDDVRQIVKDEVHNELSEFHANMTMPELVKLRKEMNERFNKVDSRFDKLEVEVRGVKDNVKGLTEEFADQPSRSDFESLKRKVESYHPSAN